MFLHRLFFVCVSLFLALVASTSYAQASGPGGFDTQVNGNTTGHTYKASGASELSRLTRGGYDPATNQSGFQELLQKKGFTPKGSQYDYKVTKPVPKAALAKAIGKTLPIVGNAIAMKELLDELFDGNSHTYDPVGNQWESRVNYTYKTFPPASFNSIPYNLVNGSGIPACTSVHYTASNWNENSGIVCGSATSTSYGVVAWVSTATKNTLVSQGWTWVANNDPKHRVHSPTWSSSRTVTPLPATIINEPALVNKINAEPTIPASADPLIPSIPPSAREQLARDIEADTSNRPRAVPTSPTGVEFETAHIPEAVSTTSSQQVTEIKTTKTIVRTLPTGELQHDTETTTTTTTQTGTNPDGSPVTETSTKTETTTTTPTPPTPAPSDSEEEGTPTDSPFPPIPELYQKKYPDGLKGVWDNKKQQLIDSPVGQLVNVLLPNIGDGGQCPAWSIDLTLSVWADYGTHDVSPPCWAWDFGRLCVIVGALVLARALIFGG